MTDFTIEQLDAMIADATPGRRVQFHPSYCPEAKGAPGKDWDTSHEMSVIRPDGTRYKMATYRHASDAAISQAAPDLAVALRASLTREAKLREGREAMHRRAQKAEGKISKALWWAQAALKLSSDDKDYRYAIHCELREVVRHLEPRAALGDAS